MNARKLGLLAVIGASLLAAYPAAHCTLDDCDLPESFHRDDPVLTAPSDALAWMNHDLAAARSALRQGERTAALAEGLALGRSLEARKVELVDLRGEARARALHAEIDELVRRAGGWGLEPLVLPDRDGIAQGVRP